MRIATDHRNLIDQFLEEQAAMLAYTAAAFGRERLSDHVSLNAIFKSLQQPLLYLPEKQNPRTGTSLREELPDP